MATKNQQLPLQGFNDHDAFQLDSQFAANVRNVRSLRERIVRSPGGTAMAPAPVPGVNAGQGFWVGSFVMRTTTGQQTIPHGLTVNPQAVLIMSAGTEVLNTTENDYHYGMGWTDGSTERSAYIASDNTATSNTARSYKAKLISMVGPGAGVISEANLVSTSSQDFIINWTTVDGTARRFIFCVIGLDTGFSAKVLEWTLTTGAGSVSVTGAGFTPQVVLHLYSSLSAAGTSGTALWGNGAMVVGGQWGCAIAAQDGVSPHNSTAVRNRDNCILMATTSRMTAFSASMTSMDADGFTVLKGVAPSNNTLITSLCLDGFTAVAIKTLTAATQGAPTTATTSGVGFQPTAFYTNTVLIGNGVFETDSDIFGASPMAFARPRS